MSKELRHEGAYHCLSGFPVKSDGLSRVMDEKPVLSAGPVYFPMTLPSELFLRALHRQVATSVTEDAPEQRVDHELLQVLTPTC